MNKVNSTQQQALPLSDKQQNAQFNNQYANALAAGDPRYQMKELDRPGMSRGAGQMNQAGIRASQAVADGIANAYSTQLANQQYTAGLQLQNQQQAEQYGQALAGLQSQANYAHQMAAMQRQNALIGLMGNFLR